MKRTTRLAKVTPAAQLGLLAAGFTVFTAAILQSVTIALSWAAMIVR
jgi:hypothetical protein